MIVEDAADFREFMQKLLTMHGYKVIGAIDGQDGVNRFKSDADNI